MIELLTYEVHEDKTDTDYYIIKLHNETYESFIAIDNDIVFNSDVFAIVMEEELTKYNTPIITMDLDLCVIVSDFTNNRVPDEF